MLHRNRRLESKLNNCKERTRLDLRKEKLTESDMILIIEEAVVNKQCSMLWLAENQISRQALSILASALSTNSTLEALSMCRNAFDDANVLHLARALSNSPSRLQRLALTSNEITDDGVQYLAEMLQANRSLTQLWLGSNKITDRGVQSLADALVHHNKTLQVLSLSRNNLITDASVEIVVDMLEANHILRVVCLSNCGLSQNGKTRLTEAVRLRKEFHLDL